jgi:uncharacterized membrane protein YhaH (DUF805 family)
MENFIDAFRNFANFSGRARRTQYWMFTLFVVMFSIAIAIVEVFLGTMFIGGLFSLAVLVPSISLAARRLHDTGRSGWWQLILLVPLIGFIVLIVFLVQDSKEDNEYGPNPKATESVAV